MAASYSRETTSPAERKEMGPFRRNMQIIFQDPYSSINPRMTVGNIVGRTAGIHIVAKGKERRNGSPLCSSGSVCVRAYACYPHEFSGGSGNASALPRACVESGLIVGDEPVSALDVSIQAPVINLLMDLQQERGLSYLFISHDLAVVEHISHNVAVMYLGKLVELADKKALYLRPVHPYTEALSPQFRFPIRPGAARSGFFSRATYRARSTRHPVAGFIPVALTRWPGAGWAAGTRVARSRSLPTGSLATCAERLRAGSSEQRGPHVARHRRNDPNPLSFPCPIDET